MRTSVELSRLQAARGAFGRWRRALRRGVLEPILVGHRSFRETVLNALSERGHLVYCELPEGNFFVDPGDRVIASWLMWHGGWQRAEIEQAVDILVQAGRLPPDAVFVDAGANIGTHTIYALRAGRFARAVAFEPEPRNARLLAMNIAANGMAERASVVTKAVGAADGTAVLHLHPRNKGAHAVGAAPSLDGRERIEVSVCRLDTALRASGIMPDQIGLIWIDVEGSELAVVRGLGDYLGRAPLAVEYAPQRYGAAERRDFQDLLARYHKTMHRLGSRSYRPEPIGALAEIDGITDLLVY
jgi:FkbM family methyltransferase